MAALLAPALGLSLLAKDPIKQALADVLGAGDVEASRALGRAARRVLTTVAATSTGAVLDSVWPPDTGSGQAVGALPGRVVEVHCDVAPELATQRYRARAAQPGAPGPADVDRDEDEQARAGEPLAGGWPLLRVDTTGEVDVGDLVERIRTAASGARQTT